MNSATGQVHDFDHLVSQGWVQVGLLGVGTALVARDARIRSLLGVAFGNQNPVQVDYDPKIDNEIRRASLKLRTPQHSSEPGKWVVTVAGFDADTQMFRATFVDDKEHESTGYDATGGGQSVVEAAISSSWEVEYLDIGPSPAYELRRVKVNRG